jgi:hypothetical protein
MARINQGRRSGLPRSILFALVVSLVVCIPKPGVVAAQADDATATTELETYEARSFGFSVSYDAAVWQIVDDSADEIEDYVVFANGPGFVTLSASTVYGGDIGECQQDWVRVLRSTPGIEDYRPLLDENGNVIAVQEEEVAYAGYAFSSADGNEFFHIECLGLIEGEATLALIVEGFVEEYPVQLAATQGLLAGLDTSEAALPVPTGDGTGGTGGSGRAGGAQGAPDDTPGRSFADAFDDPVAGFLSTASPSRTEARFAYDGGEFVIQTLVENAGIWQAGIPGAFTDASIAVDVRLGGDSPDGGLVLLGCRSNTTETSTSEYTLSLRSWDGELELTRWDDGEPVVLAAQIPENLKTGDATNRLELACVGSTITAIVNGEQVLTVEDETYASGSFFIGAGVEPGADGIVEARWDNLEVINVAA